MDKVESNKLIERIQKSDKEALQEFYDGYSKKIMAVAFYMTRNVHDAEDVLNIVLEKFWRSNFKHVDNISGLAYKVTKLSALNYLRDNKKNRDALKFNEQLERKATSTIDLLEQNMVVADILGQVKEKYRDVVFKYILFEDTFQEIADDMGISKSVIHRRYCCAIKILKQKFTKHNII